MDRNNLPKTEEEQNIRLYVSKIIYKEMREQKKNAQNL
jgi:hypothetical protein